MQQIANKNRGSTKNAKAFKMYLKRKKISIEMFALKSIEIDI